MLSVVIISYFVLIAPAWMLKILQVLNYDIEPWLDNSAAMLVMVNSVNNPVVYGLMNGNFRKAAFKLFCWKKSGNTSVHSRVQEFQQQIVNAWHAAIELQEDNKSQKGIQIRRQVFSVKLAVYLERDQF